MLMTAGQNPAFHKLCRTQMTRNLPRVNDKREKWNKMEWVGLIWIPVQINQLEEKKTPPRKFCSWLDI